jgi:sulfate adenylyltransferase
MPGLVKPHGAGPLEPLMLSGEALEIERARAAKLLRLRVSSREKGDLIMLGIGGFTPLAGFMTRADWEGVCDGYRTASGLFWPIPITLSTDEAVAAGIRTGAEVALVDPEGDGLLATMRVTEKYRIDKTHECMSVFRTTELEHPGVKLVMQQGGVNLAGVASYYGPFDAHRIFDEIPRDALETQALKMDVTFWCYRCGGMASGRTCTHGEADRLQVSGTQLRKWLSEGSPVPAEFSRPEVLEVLRTYYTALRPT